MSKKNNIKLIKGIFSPEDAKELLRNLYNSKINFHAMKNFSSNERFGGPDKNSVKRIPELKASMNSISIIIDGATDKNKKVKLTSVIEIEYV